MTNADRIEKIVATGTATGDDLTFLLDYLNLHKQVLKNIVDEYEGLDRNPSIEAYTMEHARALATPTPPVSPQS